REFVRILLAGGRIDVRLSRPRRTKVGDHRPPCRLRPRHRISLNDDLNPYAFLTTLLHEIAHASTWERYRGRRRVRPHGREWKAEFGRILEPVVAGGMLPEDVRAALGRSLADPAAATCSDRGLALALSRYDAVDPRQVFVESLTPGSVFRTDCGMRFRLGPKLRTRYQCVELGTGREYRMHALCRVTMVDGAAEARPRA
ncbi:MAG: SprT-like domain-containing protein, partial [Planctomycetia bacterium]